MARPGYNTYSASGAVTYGVYGLINGVWVKLGQQTVYFFAAGPGNPGQVTMYNRDTIRVTTSAKVDRFRVVRESVDDGIAGAVTGVADASWTSQTVSGSRTATPNGEKVTATMRPVY